MSGDLPTLNGSVESLADLGLEELTPLTAALVAPRGEQAAEDAAAAGGRSPRRRAGAGGMRERDDADELIDLPREVLVDPIAAAYVERHNQRIERKRLVRSHNEDDEPVSDREDGIALSVKLQVQLDPTDTMTVAIRKGRTRIGRHRGMKVAVRSQEVSSYHAELYVGARTVRVRDMNSSSGTVVNYGTPSAVRLAPFVPHNLRHGDVVNFGRIPARVLISERKSRRAPPAASPRPLASLPARDDGSGPPASPAAPADPPHLLRIEDEDRLDVTG